MPPWLPFSVVNKSSSLTLSSHCIPAASAALCGAPIPFSTLGRETEPAFTGVASPVPRR